MRLGDWMTTREDFTPTTLYTKLIDSKQVSRGTPVQTALAVDARGVSTGTAVVLLELQLLYCCTVVVLVVEPKSHFS